MGRILSVAEFEHIKQDNIVITKISDVEGKLKKFSGKEAFKVINDTKRELFCGHIEEVGGHWWIIRSVKITVTCCDKCMKELGLDMLGESFLEVLNAKWNRKSGLLL